MSGLTKLRQNQFNKSSLFPIFLVAFAILLCLYNFFNGFGEDSDSIRLIEAASFSKAHHLIVPSRSWGFPLYELCLYAILDYLPNGRLLGKLFSFVFICLTVLLLFRILKNLLIPEFWNFILCLVFLANPVIIIAGNSIMETSMSLFFLTATLCYSIDLISANQFGRYNLAIYGVLFGLATLVRPDNVIFFPSMFILLFLKRKIILVDVVISLVVLLTVGISPYFILRYPIFHTLPSNTSNSLVFACKDVLALFGIPLLLVLFLFVGRSYKKVFYFFKSHNDVVYYLLILVSLTLLRFLLLSDEIEYGILLWSVFIVLTGVFLKHFLQIRFKKKAIIILLSLLVTTAVPNFFQVYFFKEVNFNYVFALGITRGVLKQEDERRLYNQAVLENGDSILLKASKNIRRQDLVYETSVNFKNCDTCIVLIPVRDLNAQKAIGGIGTDMSKQRILLSPDFNISRGWRNFIKDNDMPVLTEEHLFINY